jgi:hypothetical protein
MRRTLTLRHAWFVSFKFSPSGTRRLGSPKPITQRSLLDRCRVGRRDNGRELPVARNTVYGYSCATSDHDGAAIFIREGLVYGRSVEDSRNHRPEERFTSHTPRWTPKTGH